MTDATRRRRLKRYLQTNRLLFVRVGVFAGEDRVISTHRTRPDGATVETPEYSRLIQDIVRSIK